jgi:rRNA maturation endonuclease Nob1
MIFIGILPLIEAKDIQNKMNQLGAKLFLEHNEKTCTRGCTVTVEVHCEEQYLEAFKTVMTKNYQELMDGFDVNLEQMTSVFDTGKDEAICPACGTKFQTSSSECPECGLVLG